MVHWVRPPTTKTYMQTHLHRQRCMRTNHNAHIPLRVTVTEIIRSDKRNNLDAYRNNRLGKNRCNYRESVLKRLDRAGIHAYRDRAKSVCSGSSTTLRAPAGAVK